MRRRLDGGSVSEEAFARLATHFRSPESWRIYDDVVTTLEDLRRRYLKLAIVSNWDSHLPKLLAALDLDRLAAILFFSAGVMRVKTYPGGAQVHFRAAASTGALYQTEVYVVAGAVEGVLSV